MPPDGRPSERTLALGRNAWRRRSAEHIHFSLFLSVKAGDNANTTGYTPVAPGGSLVIQQINPEKNQRLTHSIPHYLHAVEILTLSYAMVSTLDDAVAVVGTGYA